MNIVAQREIGNGLQEIVSVDLDSGVTGVLARPWEEPGAKPKDPPIVYTPQAPKTLPDGRLMVYRLKKCEQFNLHSFTNEVAIFDTPTSVARILPRPATKSVFGKQNAVTWLQHGHAAPTNRGTLIHAAVELESWWLFGWPIRKQWCVIETDYFGKPTGYKVGDRAEPSWTDRGLTTIDPTGTGRIVTPTRVFDKASSPVGAKSWGWFDPHLSPDGTKVVWLDVTSVGLDGTRSGLIIGDMATGEMRYLVKPIYAMQTDGMWIDNNRILGSRFTDGHWDLTLVDATNGNPDKVPNTVDCTAVHVLLP